MDTQQFIQSLIDNVFYAEKHKGENKYPQYYPEYQTECELAEKTRLHYDYKAKPDTLLLTKAPNQKQEEFEYAKANFKHITFPYWNKGENCLSRIWNRNNFTVKWNEEEVRYKAKPAKTYFEGDIPISGNIFDYFATIVDKWTIRDPNAIITIRPYNIPFTEDNEGNKIVDKSALIEPIPVIYQCEQIRAYKEEKYLLVEKFDKSWVEEGQTKKQTGRIFEYYDKNSIWIIAQTGIKSKNKYDYIQFYIYNLGYLPCDKLKGILENKGNLHFYLSYFSPAIPNLDEALIHNSTLQLCIYSQAFPHTWTYAPSCDAQGCTGGYIIKDGQRIKCPVCKGTGIDTRFSALGVTQIKVPDRLNEAPNIPTPPFGFVAPDIQILDFLKTTINDYIVDAFAFLNIDVSNSTPKGSDTALGKKIDREEFFSFLLLFSNQQFTLLEFVIKAMGEMRYEGFKAPEIKHPNNFTIRTYREITEELAEARKNNLPELAIEQLVNEYFVSRFNLNPTMLSIYQVIRRIDTLFIKTDAQITDGINNETIKTEDVLLHNNIISFIYTELETDRNFLEKPFEEIKNILIEKAKGQLCSCGT